jgi:hypothetical protein
MARRAGTHDTGSALWVPARRHAFAWLGRDDSRSSFVSRPCAFAQDANAKGQVVGAQRRGQRARAHNADGIAPLPTGSTHGARECGQRRVDSSARCEAVDAPLPTLVWGPGSQEGVLQRAPTAWQRSPCSVSLFDRGRFFVATTVVRERRAQPRSRLAEGHRRRRREAALTAASTALCFVGRGEEVAR